MHVDRELVSRIFENLFDNAVKFTPAEGRIRIVATTGDGRFQLCVANDGSAIPRDQRARIFEKFASGARSGMRSSHGLGLYFCKLATAAHGGTLSLAEMPPFSTAFSLSIPSHAA
ncbi:MAG: ATP-binding protein [Polyangiaceae bacterium]